MEKINRGFTLIELLAVIVILAVIALIAVPIIMNVINDSKKGAAKDSMYSYVKAVELGATQQLEPDTNLMNGTYTVKDGNLYNGATKVLGVELKGTKPEDNSGSVTLTKGQVIRATLKFDGYDIEYNGSEANNIVLQKIYTEGDIIYYNPETNSGCSIGEVNTVANAKTGCLKWNVITMGDSISKTTIDIMLDHNTTGIVDWNLDYTNAEMKEAAEALQADVAKWDSSVKITVRVISGQEIANIGKDERWDSGTYTQTVYSSQSWLYQNLSSSNTDEKPVGYWVSTPFSHNSGRQWYMVYGGYLGHVSVAYSRISGVRPVITISKSVIS